MKPIDATNLDQQDTILLLSQMKFHASRLRAILLAQEGETIQQPALSKGTEANLFSDVTKMTAHITELEHRLGDSAPKFRCVSTNQSDESAHSASKKQIATYSLDLVAMTALARRGDVKAAKIVNLASDTRRFKERLQTVPEGKSAARGLQSKIESSEAILAALTEK